MVEHGEQISKEKLVLAANNKKKTVSEALSGQEQDNEDMSEY
jgi:hypothetical protein